jgi:hypothetical protein
MFCPALRPIRKDAPIDLKQATQTELPGFVPGDEPEAARARFDPTPFLSVRQPDI